MSTRVKVVLGGLLAVVALLVGGSWLYFNVLQDEAPQRLSLDSGSDGTATSTAAAPTGELAGTYRPTSSSIVGYRVKEVAFGQSGEAVGRTNKVTGSLVIDGTTVSTGKFVVDMTSVQSDEQRRDNQFHGRIMNTSTFPTSTFELTEPITLPSVPDDTTPITVTAKGNLTLKGVTRPVTVGLQARRNGANFEVSGSIPVTFADYGIGNPSFGGVVTTEDRGLLELKLVFAKSA